jgi:hypothetical protein
MSWGVEKRQRPMSSRKLNDKRANVLRDTTSLTSRD